MADRQARYILAIDLGTSGPKVALISPRGEVADHAFEPTRLILGSGGQAEQDPEEWWTAISKAIKRLLASGPVPPDRIIAICCTAQWSGTVAVDRDGAPLGNAIIWMDTRGVRYARKVTDGLISFEGYGVLKAIRWIRLSAGILTKSGKDSISHILYLKHEQPAVYDKAYKFLEPKDYLNLRLTGRFAASFDSIHLHWVTDSRKINDIKYDDWLIKTATIDRDKLPELKRSVDVLGMIKPEVARQLGLREDVQVVMGSPDVQSASVGSGAVRDYQGHIYIGTSSWLTCHVPFKATDVFRNMASLPSSIPGRYLVTNEQETAGACLNYLRDNVFFCEDELSGGGSAPEDIYQRFDRMVERVPPGSDRVIFTPWLYGERTPIDDPTVRSSFFNQSLNTTRRHLVRAVYEGVAFNSRWLLHGVERFVKRKLDPLTIIGGGANSDCWCQIYADVCDRTIQQAADPILANLRGAAFIGAVGLGLMEFDQVPDRVPIAKTFSPNPDNRKIYDDLFAEFQNLYRRNRGIFRRLNRT